MPVVAIIKEAEAGESLEPRNKKHFSHPLMATTLNPFWAHRAHPQLPAAFGGPFPGRHVRPLEESPPSKFIRTFEND